MIFFLIFSLTDSVFQDLKIYSDPLFNRWFCSHVEIDYWGKSRDNIERRSNLSYEEFIENYAKKNKPVIITDAMNDWSAFENWKEENLLEKYSDVLFKTDKFVNESDEENIMIKLSNFFNYCSSVSDKNPLYLFDDLKGNFIFFLNK